MKILSRISAILFCSAAMISVCPSADAIGFTVKSGEKGLSVIVTDTVPSDEVEISIDGGRTYFRSRYNGMDFPSLPAGDYCISARYAGAKDTGLPFKNYHVNSRHEHYPIALNVTTYMTAFPTKGKIDIAVSGFTASGTYLITIDGGKTFRPLSSNRISFDNVTAGEHMVMVTTADRTAASPLMRVLIPKPPLKKYTKIDAEPVLQNPELPTGCEVTSLTMAVNFLGIGVNKTTLADHYLEKSKVHTVSFRRKFAGDPRNTWSYGCFAPVIAECSHKFLDNIPGRKFEITDLTGAEFEDLLRITDTGTPVIVWGTMYMKAPVYTKTWKDAETGEEVTWPGYEHCMLLTGHDEERGTVFVNDPLIGQVTYDRKLFEKRYIQLEQQAVAITEIGGVRSRS